MLSKVLGWLGNLLKLALIAAFIFAVLSGVDGYTTSIAPSRKRCEICNSEVTEWYTLSFNRMSGWDAGIKGEKSAGIEYAPYTLCPDCAAGVKSYLAWRLAGSP